VRGKRRHLGALDNVNVAEKIARLVAERGWNQDEFARRAGIHRTTARGILTHPEREPRNQTLRQCADALNLTVHELVAVPLEKLLPRARAIAGTPAAPPDFSSQPLLQTWLTRNPDRAALLTPAELEELLSLQGTGGPMTLPGVEHFVEIIERKRELHRRLEVIAGTEYLDLVEQVVELVYAKIRAYR
jgi:transcriptional regulator with XRE-family HTH domain